MTARLPSRPGADVVRLYPLPNEQPAPPQPRSPRSHERAPDWGPPVDFLGQDQLTGAPQLKPEHLPAALAPFVWDTAARMGADPASLALACIVTASAVISDRWCVQVRAHDSAWTEQPRLWGAIVGNPSVAKTPILRAATAPVDLLDARARDRHAEGMRAWKADVAVLKADKVPPESWPRQPRVDRHLIEGTTVEALTEALRDDDAATQRAPGGKLLVRQDELSEWLAGLDRYRAGGRGGGDRGAYLRLFNGGRFTVDRIGRGAFAIPSWSGCVLGGIQPEPIQRIAREAADDGLLQRFLYVVPGDQAEGVDRRPDERAATRYRDVILRLAELTPAAPPGFAAHPVLLHPDSHQHREAINALARAQAAMPDTSSRLKAALGKWPGLFARIALTFHLIEAADAQIRGEATDVPMVLAPETAQRAAAWMRSILLPHLLRAEALLFLTPQTGHAHWIAGHILASEEARATGRVTLRNITRAYHPLRAPEMRRELLAVMESLELMGWLKAEAPENRGRDPAAWRVNPTLHSTFAEAAAAEQERRRRTQAEMLAAVRRFQADG